MAVVVAVAVAVVFARFYSSSFMGFVGGVGGRFYGFCSQ